ncbi:hypothetical protein E6R60_25680 [Streptomyces sp. A0642]|uniref:hypothetical protein n=1 Tax=Streptomyces sp. A0642 TaxID=2563100 RepID=UPI0010A20C00|nr:hypothetical protein [Streptomyces sp. A0642]THA73050.1 hypothetical protein E6R60_25680 [Streptomyces sp. A0642]
MSRRAWLSGAAAAGALAAVSGGVYAISRTPEAEPLPEHEKVRTDVEPLRKVFGEAGRLSEPRWLLYDRDAVGEGRLGPPRPDPRYRAVGIARLPAGSTAKALRDPAYTFTPATPASVPQPLREFLPAQARWMSSKAYDTHLLGPEPGELTRGRFFLDAAGDQLYFDTVNPT